MLVTDDGCLTGAISGGCLEGDVLRKALYVMRQQKPVLVTYDTTDEDDAKTGLGLGCNGLIRIMIEPLKCGDNNNPLVLLESLINHPEGGVLTTLFSLDREHSQPGTCLLYQNNNLVPSDKVSSELQSLLINDVIESRASGKPIRKEYDVAGYSYSAFIEPRKPPVKLHIIGAGNDAIPVSRLASMLGWDVYIFDGRNAMARSERFPEAKSVLVSKPENVLSHVQLDQQSVFVLMTHNYIYDLQMIRQLLPLDIPYVGVLGPQKKLDRMLKELEAQGQDVSRHLLSKIYGPIGLDIGAETSEEIALSILAEIKSVLAGKKPRFLREKKGPIHEDRSQLLQLPEYE